ncbi:hypothetical protein PGT21_026061 [Puccinia graminis f. sp. tritici]|uniref:Secreted protein n=1 Tax=Puccinia graminis f. sp. tritici TaxID=56615 RepID=A0A5B0M2X6_PUCGR|nr:hypothetical protein PGT21_026061 [Puccinia graminis f. sp. tritici]KAA1132615.1 hypothetical protein PGTUg99_015104 [Puccinia graminis f. sp. tritici]
MKCHLLCGVLLCRLDFRALGRPGFRLGIDQLQPWIEGALNVGSSGNRKHPLENGRPSSSFIHRKLREKTQGRTSWVRWIMPDT